MIPKNTGKPDTRKMFVKSPLNYTGGKYKLLPQLIELFPNEELIFIDLFGGGFNVGINAKQHKIIYNDISEQVTRLIKLFSDYESEEIIRKIDSLIVQYNLSNSYKNGYEYYGCDSNSGLGKYNKEKFIRLREDYNRAQISVEKDFLFLLVIIFAFNNQIRFNSSGLYNLPVGKRDFNSSVRKNIRLFADKIKTKDVSFMSIDFKNIDFKKNSNSFVYCDPPYLLGDASYNENGGWNESKELELLDFLKDISDHGIKFALSNVLEHKGKTNVLLLEWAKKNDFKINYIEMDYSNSNYHAKHKSEKTVEVLITNY